MVRVPSSQLGAPALGIVPFDDVPSAPSIGEALAGAASEISQAFVVREKRIERIRRARQTSTGIVGIIEDLNKAEIEGQDADPARAIEIYDASIAEIRQSIEDIDDEVVQANLAIQLDTLGRTGRIRIQRDVRKREKQETRKSHNELANQLATDVDAGRIQLPVAISSFNNRIDDALISVYSETEAQARVEVAAARFVRVEYNRLLREDPGLAAIFIESDPLAQVLPSDERRRRIATAQRALEQHEAILAENALDSAKSQLRAILSQDTDAVSSDAVEVLATSFVEAMPQFPGFQIKGRFVPGKTASTDDLKLILLEDELAIAAANGDERRVAAILPSMPNTADAQAIVTNAKATLARVMKARADADIGAQRLRAAFISGDISVALPNDQRSLNAFYQDTQFRNEDIAKVAGFLAEAGKNMPGDLLRDIRGLTDEGTKNLPKLVRILVAVGTVRAGDLVAASSNPDLASASIDATPSDLDLLSNPLVPDMLKAADLHFRGDERKKIEGVDIQAAIKSAFKQKITPNTEQLVALKARYFVRFAEFRVTLGDTSDDEDVAQRAALRAAEDIARDFEPVAGVLIRKTLIDDLDLERFARAVGSGRTQITTPPLFGPVRGLFRFLSVAEPVRPDLLFRANGKVYVPIVTETGPTAFIEVDPLDYKSRRIERGTGDFTILENRLRSNVAPVDFDPFSDLRHREEYGATSIQGYDEQFGADFGGSLYARVQAQLTQAGLLDEMSPEQQKQLIDVTAQDVARRIGWESVLKPASSGE